MLPAISLIAALTAVNGPAFKCDPNARELKLDPARSEVRWRGTKFWGLGKHEGTVRFQGGGLCVRENTVLSGWFEVDMRTIEVTDIPADDPVPRNRLREHLLSPNFFHAAEFPVARFLIQSVKEEKPRLFQIRGNLTIRNQTRPVSFYARGWSVSNQEVRAEARMEVERHQFGVAYRGSTLRDDLVDDTFWLDLVILAN